MRCTKMCNYKDSSKFLSYLANGGSGVVGVASDGLAVLVGHYIGDLWIMFKNVFEPLGENKYVCGLSHGVDVQGVSPGRDNVAAGHGLRGREGAGEGGRGEEFDLAGDVDHL